MELLESMGCQEQVCEADMRNVCMWMHGASQDPQSYEVCPRGQTDLHQAKKRTSQSSGVPVLVPAQKWLQAVVITHLNSPVPLDM